jgi:hypothetical protein
MLSFKYKLLNIKEIMNMLLIVLVLLVGELVRFELEKRKVSKKRIELSKIKAEVYAENKRLQFEEYREYIENKYNDVDIKEVDEVDIQEITFVEGVQQLRDNGHKYVPYVRANPLDDIRSSLSEFTVSDVINTFYF